MIDAEKIPCSADRMIVATALHFDAPLVTKDRLIRSSKLVRTIW